MPSDVVISDDRLEMKRFFPYPRDLVFRAWADPDMLAQWWGCRETERVTAEIDPRPGGVFRYQMHMSHGDMTYEGVYDEFIEPERIVTRTEMGAGTEYAFTSTVTVDFKAVEGGTEVTLTQVGLPPMPDCGNIIAGGFTDAFDKLEGLMTTV
ncbi:MAG: SRPBCC domain-containing protein [Planctomycetota bacterium]